MRARHDPDRRIGAARLFHDLARFEGFRNRNEQHGGARDIGGGQDIALRGIAGDVFYSGFAQFFDRVLRFLDHKQRLAAHLLRHQMPHAAEADQHGMAA